MSEISVIIATINRAEALKTISLPSLAKQSFKNFEVIIWDASDSSSSKNTAKQFLLSYPEMTIRYFKAQRIGLASQRNDAIKVAKGKIIFFIDDDSEISNDGLYSLEKLFGNKKILGGGLKLESRTTKERPLNKKNRHRCANIYYSIFRMPHSGKKRLVMLSGGNIWPEAGEEHFEEVEWLPGFSMAFRRSIFDKFGFEEKLEKFGGYALAEDVQFSHRIFRNKMKLMLSGKGYVIHHQSKGGRLAKAETFAAQIYNQFLTWKTAIYPYNKLSVFVYLWSLSGEILRYYLAGIFRNDFLKIKGVSMGLRAIVLDIFDTL